ncbi:MAG: ABC transporter permease subunit [Sphingomonadaceae bacterium]|nr:ABC transporter permease subunit [Sphingomonadaceae bacterium]
MARSSRRRFTRSDAAQLAVLAAVGALIAWLVENASHNLASRGITSGFGFLSRAARFPISESLLSYSPVDSFAWALAVGLGNTLLLSVIVALLSTVLGLPLALGRRSRNPVVSGLATTFVDVVRNTPLIVQLLFFYSVLIFALPGPGAALHPLPGVFLTNRGLYLPWITSVGRWALDLPRTGRFNFSGGIALSPEFAAIVTGLTLYSTAFAAEIIRTGIEAVPRGQWEAARALGLPERRLFRLVVTPQALRVIVPPMTSQYINIIKNSTLALVVGYPDLSFVIATTINQTGQAVEGVTILVVIFLSISFSASAAMNAYNRRLALVGR